MAKKFLVATAFLLVCIRPAFAVPVNCTTLVTLADFIGSSDGCFVQDKLFTGFSYAGGGSIGADDVNVAVVFASLPGNDLHGFVISPAAGSWNVGFTWGYAIQVDPPNPLVSIVGSKLQGNFGRQPPAATATSTKSNGLVQVVTLGQETKADAFLGVQALVSSTEVTIPTGSILISLEETYTQAIQSSGPVPEPASLTLVGTGLAAIARRQRRRRPRG